MAVGKGKASQDCGVHHFYVGIAWLKLCIGGIRAFFLVLAVIPFAANAQIMAPPEGMQFYHVPKWNPEFISSNGIKEIRAVMETKRDGDRIRKTHRETVYQFDREGKGALVAHINRQLNDTSITAWQYSDRTFPEPTRRLECEVRSDASGLFSYCYSYNAEGLPVERKYSRLERWQPITSANFAAKGTKVNTETYTHSRYDGQLHTTLHNSAGRPYQKDIRYYDADGYLVKYMRSFVLSSERHEEVYTYEVHGWLAALEVTFGRQLHRMEWKYDEVGNLLVEERFEQGSKVYHKEFVYEGANMLLRAELTRREGDEMLEITTFTYVF